MSRSDCLPRCLDKMLNLKMHTTPDFWRSDSEPERLFWRRLRSWLRGRRMVDVITPLQASTQGEAVALIKWASHRAPLVLIGLSPRGRSHAVLLRRGRVWDPHPSRLGLVGPLPDGMFHVMSLSPILMTPSSTRRD